MLTDPSPDAEEKGEENIGVHAMKCLTGSVFFVFENKPSEELQDAKLELANLSFYSRNLYLHIIINILLKYRLIRPIETDTTATFFINNATILVDQPPERKFSDPIT